MTSKVLRLVPTSFVVESRAQSGVPCGTVISCRSAINPDKVCGTHVVPESVLVSRWNSVALAKGASHSMTATLPLRLILGLIGAAGRLVATFNLALRSPSVAMIFARTRLPSGDQWMSSLYCVMFAGPQTYEVYSVIRG